MSARECAGWKRRRRAGCFDVDWSRIYGQLPWWRGAGGRRERKVERVGVRVERKKWRRENLQKIFFTKELTDIDAWWTLIGADLFDGRKKTQQPSSPGQQPSLTAGFGVSSSSHPAAVWRCLVFYIFLFWFWRLEMREKFFSKESCQCQFHHRLYMFIPAPSSDVKSGASARAKIPPLFRWFSWELSFLNPHPIFKKEIWTQ